MILAQPLFTNDEMPVYVYDWKAWGGYLFPSLCTNAIKIEAKIRQSNTDILRNVVADRGYFLFHLNLTKTAFFFKDKEDLLAQLRYKGITIINGNINDTSKQCLQNTCKQIGLNFTKAFAQGDPNELLITKTNFNHGGKPEKRLLRSEFRRLKLGSKDYSTDIIYPVMERSKIEKGVWKDENLIVEKYIANEQNYFFRVYKLLNRVIISEVINHDIIKKMTSGIKRTNYYYDLNNSDQLPGDNVKFHDLISDIKKLSDTLHLDFAAFDVVKSHDEKYYIIDVNLTPNWNLENHTDLLNFLSAGLYTNENQQLVERAINL